MFLPFGFCLPLLWNISGKKAVLAGFGVSLFIEFSQLFLARGTDIDDLILNTLGAGAGLAIYKAIAKRHPLALGRYK